jgi:hypothetical protein
MPNVPGEISGVFETNDGLFALVVGASLLATFQRSEQGSVFNLENRRKLIRRPVAKTTGGAATPLCNQIEAGEVARTPMKV